MGVHQVTSTKEVVEEKKWAFDLGEVSRWSLLRRNFSSVT